ncbi:MAG: methyltransferase domain-containing protein [Mycolicibacterium aromaticivorans]|nr:methyltransferase domain-containing protein [Mycolicibacterium aromaticivorans]
MDAEEHFATLAAVWDSHADAMDAAMGEHAWAARAALAAAPGERIVDVGCGAGLSAVALGAEVGADGWVAAVDVAAEMVAAAARRMSAAGVHGVAVTADAGTADLVEIAGAGQPFDAVHARFGLMFFDEPEAAMANIFRALRPGGRLAASVWQQLIGNLWMVLTTATAMPILGGDRPPLPEPGRPGPFSMADPEATTALLTGAGFVDVAIRPVESPFLFEGDGAAAAQRVLSAGPLGPRFLSADAVTRRAAVDGVVDALAPYRGPTGYLVPAASWCVTARRP